MMATTPTLRDDDRPLPRWAYFSLATLAGAIGIAASIITARFFVIGLDRTEVDSIARDVLILAGVLMIVVELAAFFIAALVPQRQLRALRWKLITCAVLLVGFEFATIAVTQAVLARSADAVHDGTSGRIANLQATISAQRSAAAALVATGSRSGQSVIASSRADGAQALREAARIEARTSALSAELASLQAGQRPTLTAVLGEPLTLAYNCARAALITVMGLVMFAAAGSLLRAGRASAVLVPVPAAARSGYAHGIEAAPAGSIAAALPSVSAARRWAAAGVPLAAIPAAAFAAPTVTAPTYPTTSYSAPLATAPTIAPNPVQSLEPIAPVSVQSVELGGAVDPAPAKPRTAPRKPHASVEVGHKMDSGVGPEDGYRYRRIRDAVQAGELKPSIRAIQAAEGGGTDIVRGYLAELERASVIEKQGRGYRLTAAATA